jgi:hypothetical protein
LFLRQRCCVEAQHEQITSMKSTQYNAHKIMFSLIMIHITVSKIIHVTKFQSPIVEQL